MNKFLFYLGLFGGKITYFVFKLFGRNASHSPGAVATTICKDFIALCPKAKNVVVVCATNGKTTTANMVSDMLEAMGETVSSNRLGSNIVPGVTTAFINSLTFFWKVKADSVILEVDERASRLIVPGACPNFVLVPNIFRDSLKRNAYPEYIFSVIENSIQNKDGVLILNSDDIFSSRLLENGENKRVFFGLGQQENEKTINENLIFDHSFCPMCKKTLEWDYLRYHHIGKCHCPNCGFQSKTADYLGTTIDTKAHTLEITSKGKALNLPLIDGNLFNIYNEIGIFALLSEMGFSPETIQAAFTKTTVVSSRLEVKKVGNHEVIQAMAKGQSCVSTCRTLDFVGHTPGKKAVIFVVDDMEERLESSEFIGWIYDGDYEYLDNEDTIQLIVAGPRHLDYRVRLRLAGFEPEKIVNLFDENEIKNSIDYDRVEKIFILYDTSTYSLAMDVKKQIIETIKHLEV